MRNRMSLKATKLVQLSNSMSQAATVACSDSPTDAKRYTYAPLRLDIQIEFQQPTKRPLQVFINVKESYSLYLLQQMVCVWSDPDNYISE